MLAKLHEGAFDNPNWIYEIKWDGYRAIAEVAGNNSRLYSRNGLNFADEYAVVFEELKKLKKKLVLDGEIVALDEDGKPSFQLLQQYRQNGDVPLVYYVFDILSQNDKSLEDKPLIERKEILRKLLPDNPVIRYCDHIEERGTDFFKAMQKQGLEGMIAKRADSTYLEGSRSSDWLKIKHMLTDEAIICGYTQARGGRKFFGALILGTYEKGKLIYIGHTGTGFDHKTLKEVYAQLKELETDENPFGVKVKVNSPVTWVKPKLVCQLKYTEVTDEGARRHPVFMGLRKDKAPKDVHTEAPVSKEKKEPVIMKKTANKKVIKAAKPAAKKAATKKTAARKTAVKKTAAKKTAAKKNTTKKEKEENTTIIAGKPLQLTNQDKIYWPGEGYTKGDVINYYNEVSKYILPYLKDRPESLKRNPNGINGPAFFHKDAGENAPEWMKTYPVWSESSDKTVDYLVCNDKPSLLYMANLGCIEINPWNSRIQSPENPDWFVMDIDPSDNNTFDQVIDCALVIKEILDKAKIQGYAKTSGSSGMHIYVPLGAKYSYDEAKQFAEMIALMTQEQIPGITTVERSLKKRSKDKIYVDFLQNRRGQTLSAAYSLRPKPGAPVSTPLEWKEVKHGIDPRDYNINNTLQRVQKKGDLFAPVLRKGIDMIKAIKNLGM